MSDNPKNPFFLCPNCEMCLEEDVYQGMSLLRCDKCTLLFGDENDPDCERKMREAIDEYSSDIEFVHTPEKDLN